MRRLAALLLVALLMVALGPARAAAASPAPALAEVQVIGLPGVQRRIDHFAVDPAGQRLFVSALGNHTLEVLDVAGGTRITSITGLDEPQGVAYLPSFTGSSRRRAPAGPSRRSTTTTTTPSRR